MIKNSTQQKKPKLVSVVIPIFNEEKSIKTLHAEIATIFKKLKTKYEVIIVNDGSSDTSQSVVEEICKKDKKTTGIELRLNQGKATALRAGFDKANGEVVLTLDGDLQDDPKDIALFLEKISEGYDLVCGWKYKRLDSKSKTLPSKFANFVTNLFLKEKLHDINCGFKAYTGSLAKSLNLHGELHRYIPVMAQARGYTIAEVKVNHRSRKHGSSKYNWRRFFHGFFDIITVVYLTKFQHKPLHIFGFLGLINLVVGFSISLYLTFIKFFLHQNIGQRPLLQLAVLLIIIGVQMGMIGLIAQQLTYFSYKNMSPTVIKKIVNGKKE